MFLFFTLINTEWFFFVKESGSSVTENWVICICCAKKKLLFACKINPQHRTNPLKYEKTHFHYYIRVLIRPRLTRYDRSRPRMSKLRASWLYFIQMSKWEKKYCQVQIVFYRSIAIMYFIYVKRTLRGEFFWVYA